MVTARYQRRVRRLIQGHAPLGDRGSGDVVVGLRLSRSGRLLRAFVQQSSGNPAVDRAALLSVRAAEPFPRIPPGIAAGQLALAIPFHFE
jgi:protein TonB